MMNKKKLIFNISFLILVFSITIYYIFHDQDISCIVDVIQTADIKYWIYSILFVVFFIVAESFIIYYMMKSIRQKVKPLNCLLYSFIGFFFSCITPSASGGQPAQIYFMKKDKIPIPVGTLVLMIVTITYKLVLIIIGVAVLVIRPVRIMTYLEPVIAICYFGILLNVICVGIMLLLVFHPSLAKSLLISLIELLAKLRVIRRKKHYLLKIDNAMQQYSDVSTYFRTHKIVICNVMLITLLQRIALFCVTYFTYKSFGLGTEGFVTIVVLQGMISVAVDMLPLPGGMGISEKLFLSIFAPVFGFLTLPAMIVSRGLSYYTELVLSAIFTVIAFFTLGRKNERKTEE